MKIVTFKWCKSDTEQFTLPSQLNIKYTPNHVHTFYAMCDKNVKIPFEKICITDDPAGIDSSITTIPLWDYCRNLGGCWNRLYVWSKDMKNLIGERFICMDLDIIIMDDITDLLTRTEECVLYKQENTPDYPHDRWNGSMFMMNAGARNYVWDDFWFDPDRAIREVRLHNYVGTDQAWMLVQLPLHLEAHWSIKDGIYDMRQHLIDIGKTQPPEDAKIITWPGPRDPSLPEWQKKYPWITDYYHL